MSRDVEALRDLVFTHPETEEEYGTIRPCEVGTDHPAAIDGAEVFADDDCGNVFLLLPNGVVVFWDHETDETTELARDWNAFSQGCKQSGPVELDESDVLEVWIDPEFSKEHGVDVPPDDPVGFT